MERINLSLFIFFENQSIRSSSVSSALHRANSFVWFLRIPRCQKIRAGTGSSAFRRIRLAYGEVPRTGTRAAPPSLSRSRGRRAFRESGGRSEERRVG